MGFMYQLPPGLAEARDKQAKADQDKVKGERDAERFPLLKNAPREGNYTMDMNVRSARQGP